MGSKARRQLITVWAQVRVLSGPPRGRAERPSLYRAREDHDGSKAYGFAEAPTDLPMCPELALSRARSLADTLFFHFSDWTHKETVRTFRDEFADCSTPGESAQPSLIAGALSLSGHSDLILRTLPGGLVPSTDRDQAPSA